MAARAWRKIGSGKVPEREGMAWTQIVESVTPGKLLKIDVPRTQANPPADQGWKPDIQPAGCTADGVISTAAPNSAVVLSGAPGGCLIGRIGGSTVDMVADPVSANPPTKILFSVGQFCVFAVPLAFPGGALFLGANDVADKMNAVKEHLLVDVYEAL
jgi:hypothetical protein